MSEPYEEIVDGETISRSPPGVRHERICAHLHAKVTGSLVGVSVSRLLAPRSFVQLKVGTMLRPDLALVTAATGKIWLAAEIVSSDDHRIDTVTKKAIYEDLNLPRLWMIDPRYDNVEIYHSSQYGLVLKYMLAGHELLTEKLLPEFQMDVSELFGNSKPLA